MDRPTERRPADQDEAFLDFIPSCGLETARVPTDNKTFGHDHIITRCRIVLCCASNTRYPESVGGSPTNKPNPSFFIVSLGLVTDRVPTQSGAGNTLFPPVPLGRLGTFD